MKLGDWIGLFLLLAGVGVGGFFLVRELNKPAAMGASLPQQQVAPLSGSPVGQLPAQSPPAQPGDLLGQLGNIVNTGVSIFNTVSSLFK
ncbi:MAG: hypothetical protein ACOZIN_08535 [Myxococcota bacterium]